jgi:hypothetical protein
MMWQGMWTEQMHLMGVCYLTAAMTNIHQTGGYMTGGTVAATGVTTIAGIGEKPTMTQTIGIPMSIIGRTAVTAASVAAEGSTDGGGGTVGLSATHLR